MKTLRNLVIVILGVFIAQYAQAQSSMKEPVEFKLKNGLTVIVAENLNSAKVYSGFTIDAEAVEEGNKPGIYYVLNAMLNETAAQTPAGVSFDEKGGNVAAIADDFDESLSILSSSIQKPAMNLSTFENVKAKLIASIKARDHYYPESVTETAVQNLTLNDVEKLYSKHITPSRAYLTIAGNITADAAKALVKKSFGNWDETVVFAKTK